MPEIPHRNIEAEILDIEERTWDASGAQELQDIKEDIESLFEELENALKAEGFKEIMVAMGGVSLKKDDEQYGLLSVTYRPHGERRSIKRVEDKAELDPGLISDATWEIMNHLIQADRTVDSVIDRLEVAKDVGAM